MEKKNKDAFLASPALASRFLTTAPLGKPQKTTGGNYKQADHPQGIFSTSEDAEYAGCPSFSLQTSRPSCAMSFGRNPYLCITVGALERVLIHHSGLVVLVSPQCGSLPGSPLWSIATFRVRALKPPPSLAPAQIQHLSPSASLLRSGSI